jgi:hypothetical protein
LFSKRPRIAVASKHHPTSKADIWQENSLTAQGDGRFLQCGAARDRWYIMRDEFASKSFLAVTFAGVVLLCSGLVALAFN